MVPTIVRVGHVDDFLRADDVAAIRVEHLAAHIGRIFAGEKDVTGRNLIWLPGPLHRSARAVFGDTFRLEGGRNERRPYWSGRHRVGTDTLLGQQLRQTRCEILDRPFVVA